MMNILLLGGPGAGKGTSAKIMTDFMGEGITHISTGELFRYHMANETEIGLKVIDAIKAGGLANDNITTSMMCDVMEENYANENFKGFIFDGFPRTLTQGPLLEGLLGEFDLELNAVIYLKTTDEILLERLAKRADKENRPEDANIEYSTKRVKVFHEQTEPLIEYYSDKGLLYTIDSTASLEVVEEELKKIVGEIKSKK